MRQLSLPFPLPETEIVFPSSVLHLANCGVVYNFDPSSVGAHLRDPQIPPEYCNGFFVCPVCEKAFGWCVDADPITDPEEHPPYCMHNVDPEDLAEEKYGVASDREETVN